MTSSILYGNSNEDHTDQLNLLMACKHGKKKMRCGRFGDRRNDKINLNFTGKFGRQTAGSVWQNEDDEEGCAGAPMAGVCICRSEFRYSSRGETQWILLDLIGEIIQILSAEFKFQSCGAFLKKNSTLFMSLRDVTVYSVFKRQKYLDSTAKTPPGGAFWSWTTEQPQNAPKELQIMRADE